jgi:hypothetical protein
MTRMCGMTTGARRQHQPVEYCSLLLRKQSVVEDRML